MSRRGWYVVYVALFAVTVIVALATLGMFIAGVWLNDFRWASMVIPGAAVAFATGFGASRAWENY
jgi:hypothetical protein